MLEYVNHRELCKFIFTQRVCVRCMRANTTLSIRFGIYANFFSFHVKHTFKVETFFSYIRQSMCACVWWYETIYQTTR